MTLNVQNAQYFFELEFFGGKSASKAHTQEICTIQELGRIYNTQVLVFNHVHKP